MNYMVLIETTVSIIYTKKDNKLNITNNSL